MVITYHKRKRTNNGTNRVHKLSRHERGMRVATNMGRTSTSLATSQMPVTLLCTLESYLQQLSSFHASCLPNTPTPTLTTLDTLALRLRNACPKSRCCGVSYGFGASCPLFLLGPSPEEVTIKLNFCQLSRWSSAPERYVRTQDPVPWSPDDATVGSSSITLLIRTIAREEYPSIPIEYGDSGCSSNSTADARILRSPV